MLKVKRLTKTAELPKRGSLRAAGFDLCLDQDQVVLHPGKRAICKTGIAVGLPPGTYGRIAPRSSLAAKSGIDVLAGVIDQDYTGEIGVVLLNTDDKTHVYRRGERIAQFIVEAYLHCDLEEVHDLDSTARGDGGFGSTGLA
jgi:dUTP pyrophosphatase